MKTTWSYRKGITTATFLLQ